MQGRLTMGERPRCYCKLYSVDAIECQHCDHKIVCSMVHLIATPVCAESILDGKSRTSKKSQAIDLINELLSKQEYTVAQLAEIVGGKTGIGSTMVQRIVGDLKMSGVLVCRTADRHRLYRKQKR
jgi:hypothetical protein